ncbi:PadR family transcriptional regulator [Streptomyces sp. NPDC090052]|uniref:PadR family transcriptional regulator n=1 Tax=unclassified Streptomyces TaxID=2593676 RepID=UPI002257C200|nr:MULTISPECIES: PadR family transcriptional regulator [unclassified Streptomyces]MCX4725146.1 PadR family transcriptional regulator [Streptomyces sp. NBC_01306]WSV05438.1 PadR family transcriptional regulator [Streptomyces sp. NBC_01020]WSX43504.1 PadR family transcriptional regulator [Streptomyces sp. NBC_00963]WSX68466.1 PadR family transcriptional regulator [Streptomyces sp. NBC_00932]
MERGKASHQTPGKVESQLRKGVLEYCVLALMRDGPKYGVELLSALQDTTALTTSQGTVYPLLSRLRRDALVDTAWQESASGPPRRYYSLTEAGHAALEEFAGIWPGFRDAVDHLLQPNTSPRPHPGKAHP